MQRRSKEQQRNIKYYNHNLEVMKYQEKVRQGDLWYRVIKFINSFENGKFFDAHNIRQAFQRKSEDHVWAYIHAIRHAGYIEIDKASDWGGDLGSRFKKLHDVPYHISRDKFEKNHSGKMLWIEAEVLFKKE